ncbi:hypothetical protein BTS2_2246 [Bacillus sp. TS-2]|nr:hypothetical protein BTS2_2246 [Bacillus sp. TS-2]
MKRQVCSSLLCLFLLSGCIISTEIIDEISIISAIAYDKGSEEHLIKMAVNFPTFSEQVVERKIEQQTLQGEGDTPKAIINKLNQRAQKPLVTGQLRMALFSEKLADEGLEPYILPLYRDPTVGNRILLVVIEEGEASELLTNTISSEEQVGVFLADLVMQNMERGPIPNVNLHEFLFDLYSDARDPYLPIIRKKDGSVDITGLALFDRDTMKMKVDVGESFYIKLLLSNAGKSYHQFFVEVENEKMPIVIEVVRSHRKRHLEHEEGEPKVTFKLDIKSEIYDTGGNINLENKMEADDIEKQIEEEIVRSSERLLNMFRDHDIDPIGIGELYRSKTRKWHPDEWASTIYHQVSFEVEANVTLNVAGAVE